MTLMTFVYLIAGLVLLVAGAEVLVRGAARLAAQFGISPLVIGLTVVAFGTSAPETAVSVQASLNGSGDIAIGNVVGSNIANLGLVLGLPALSPHFQCRLARTGTLDEMAVVVEHRVDVWVDLVHRLLVLDHDGRLVADGTPEAARRLARVLWNDPATGVMRHADAGYETAIECARANGLDLPSLR